ncbi:MAG: hypothetical protein U0234_14465 [Sandaracinus sp.]
MRWGIGAAVLALVGVACSGGSAPPSSVPEVHATPEPPPSSAPPAPPTTALTEAPAPSEAPPPATEAASLAATAQPAELRGRYVQRIDVVDAVTPDGIATVRFLHPSPTARSRIQALVDEDVRQFVDDVRDEGERAERMDVGCAPVAATRVLVSLVCTADWEDLVEREYEPGWSYADFTYVIEGDEVRRSTETGLVDDIGTAEPVVAALAIASEGGSEAYEPYLTVLGDHALRVYWAPHQLFGATPVHADIPYEQLLDHVSADGPIARMLRLGAFAAEATAEAPAATPGQERAVGPWAVGPAVPLREAAVRWAALDPRLRSAVGFLDGSEVRLAIDAAVDVETAREAARALGSAPLEPLETGTVVSPFVLERATGSVNVRTAGTSSSGWVATLPRGAVVVGTVVAGGGRRDWLRVVVSGDVDGFSSGRYLDDGGSCLPDASAFAATLPAEARSTILRIRDLAPQAGHLSPAVLFLAHDATRSWASLRALSRSCRTGSEIGSWTVEGTVVDALVTRTERMGGEALVLLETGTTPSAGARWLALRVGAAAPIWEQAGMHHPSIANDVLAPATVGPSGRGFWPLAVPSPGGPIRTFHWDAETHALVADAPG